MTLPALLRAMGLPPGSPPIIIIRSIFNIQIPLAFDLLATATNRLTSRMTMTSHNLAVKTNIRKQAQTHQAIER
jgi:hypothetical protein